MPSQITEKSIGAGIRVRRRTGQHAMDRPVQYMFRTGFTQIMGYRENGSSKMQLFPVPSDTGPYGGHELRNASETGITPDKLELLKENDIVKLGPNDYKRWKNICYNAKEWAHIHGLEVASIQPGQSPAHQLASAIRNTSLDKFNIALIHPHLRTPHDMQIAKLKKDSVAKNAKNTQYNRFIYKDVVEYNIRNDKEYQAIESLKEGQKEGRQSLTQDSLLNVNNPDATRGMNLSGVAVDAHKGNIRREEQRTSHQQQDDAWHRMTGR